MKKRGSYRARVSIFLPFFFAAVFAVPALRDGDMRLWILTAAVPGIMLILLLIPSRFFFLDRSSLSAAIALWGFGIMAYAMVSTDASVSQALRCAGSIFFVFCGAVLLRSFRVSLLSSALTAVLALGMISLPIWLSDEISLAEAGVALLFISFAAFLSLRMYLLSLGAIILGLLFLLLQSDFGTALVWSITSVLTFWACSGSGLWSCIALLSVGGLSGIYFGLFLVTPDVVTDPLLPKLSALPLFAPDLTDTVIGEKSDSLFFLLGEQYGLILPLCVFLLICVLILRGASLSLNTRRSFHATLALGIILLIGLRAILFLLSLTDLLFFQPGDLPFLSTSVPILSADSLLLGLLSGIAARNEADLDEDARLTLLAH